MRIARGPERWAVRNSKGIMAAKRVKVSGEQREGAKRAARRAARRAVRRAARLMVAGGRLLNSSRACESLTTHPASSTAQTLLCYGNFLQVSLLVFDVRIYLKFLKRHSPTASMWGRWIAGGTKRFISFNVCVTLYWQPQFQDKLSCILNVKHFYVNNESQDDVKGVTYID